MAILELSPNNPTLFQQYFGEFTVSTEGSSLTYENPLAHLGLPQVACESSSMESSNTGSRFWLCIFDDPISRDNGTSNDEQRAAAISKFGSISKLRDPSGYILSVQTPWVCGDLGDVQIQQNEKDPERPLAVRIDPVIEIRPEAKHKPLLELREEDVILNFLPKLNWKFVRDEMRSPKASTSSRRNICVSGLRKTRESNVRSPSNHYAPACVHVASSIRHACRGLRCTWLSTRLAQLPEPLTSAPSVFLATKS